MSVLDKFFKKFAYKFEKGYPDINNEQDILLLESLLKNFNIDVKYEWKNNLLLELDQNYDITFIDTWHVYGQLKRELAYWNQSVKKYIIMHDTALNAHAYVDSKTHDFKLEEVEPGDYEKEGLLPAIDDFLNTAFDGYLPDKFNSWLNYSLGSLVIEILVAIEGPNVLVDFYEEMGKGLTFSQTFEKIFGTAWNDAIPIISKTISGNLQRK